VNPTAGTTAWFTVSWIVELLPYMDNAALDSDWSANGAAYNQKPTVGLGYTICPSDPRTNVSTTPVLAYVVNAGLPDTDIQTANSVQVHVNGPHSGVFHNLHRFPTDVMSLDYLSTHDGSQNTLMLSENIQGTEWSRPYNNSIQEDTSLTPWQAEVGMVWWRITGSGITTPFAPTTNLGKIGINAGKDDGPQISQGDIAPTDLDPAVSPNGWTSLTAAQATEQLAYARPSSRHPGGVNATFCDGHTQFLNDTIDYRVFQQIMTPARRHPTALDSSGNRWYNEGVFDATLLAP